MGETLRVLTPADCAKVLKLSERTDYNYLRQGKLRGRRVGGGKWRVLEEDVKAFVRGEDEYEAMVDRGIMAMVCERMSEEESGERVSLEELKAELGL